MNDDSDTNSEKHRPIVAVAPRGITPNSIAMSDGLIESAACAASDTVSDTPSDGTVKYVDSVVCPMVVPAKTLAGNVSSTTAVLPATATVVMFT
jgi:hypothetical protein